MINILVVDDHQMMRELLSDRLAKAGLHVCGTAADGRAAVAQSRALRPDVVLMDISLPGVDGIEAARQIRSEGIETAVLCLTMHLDMEQLQRALQVPVDGYAVKNDSFQELGEAIQIVAQGGRFLSPRLSQSQAVLRIWQAAAGQQPGPAAHERLTPRELEVISLVAAGLEKAEIASRLSISVRTVDAHRAHIADKTGMRRIAELTRFAVRRCLVNA
jgi:DNA-binding NarL/FixJ family response regulator